MLEPPPAIPPKVFISYCQTNDPHCAWVLDLAERLTADGVDVWLDRWMLRDGHDLYHFMESMVADSSIKRVIVVSDAKYAEKADQKTGGVGTETQILTPEVYNKVKQERVIPVLRERDGEGKECLPTFLKGRIYIDFCDPDDFGEAYERLIRNIYDRPALQKPAIGRPPAHLFEEAPSFVGSRQKSRRFRECLRTGHGNLAAAFDDAIESLVVDLESLRLDLQGVAKADWWRAIMESVEASTSLRDCYVDLVNDVIRYSGDGRGAQQVVGALEKVVPFTQEPEGSGARFRSAEDNFKVVCYEMFLYTFAAFVKAKMYSEARELIDHAYVAPRIGGNSMRSYGFTGFNSYARLLEEGQPTSPNWNKRISVTGDLLVERANRSDLRLHDIMQADAILCLAAGGSGWFPRTAVFWERAGTFELFLRAKSAKGLTPLATLLNLRSPAALVELFESPGMGRVFQSEDFWHGDVTGESMDFHNLSERWRGIETFDPS